MLCLLAFVFGVLFCPYCALEQDAAFFGAPHDVFCSDEVHFPQFTHFAAALLPLAVEIGSMRAHTHTNNQYVAHHCYAKRGGLIRVLLLVTHIISPLNTFNAFLFPFFFRVSSALLSGFDRGGNGVFAYGFVVK